MSPGFGCRLHKLPVSNAGRCAPAARRSQPRARPLHTIKIFEHKTTMCAHADSPAQPARPKSSLLLTAVAGQTTRCHVFVPQRSDTGSSDQGISSQGFDSTPARSHNGDGGRSHPGSEAAAVLMLSDIFGCDTTDNLRMCQRLANELQCSAYMPDLFRGEPWPEDTPVSAGPFEEWRSNIGGAIRSQLVLSSCLLQQQCSTEDSSLQCDFPLIHTRSVTQQASCRVNAGRSSG